MKELRITAVVPMPDDAMEAGEKMAAFRPQIQALQEAIGVKVESKLVRPVERKSAAAKAEPAAETVAHLRPAKTA